VLKYPHKIYETIGRKFNSWDDSTMSDYQDILSMASQLPVDDRLRLIDDLASSVPDDRPPNLSPEWLAEIQRRSDEIDAGTVKTESWSVIRERLYAKHGVRDGN
jgi:putative addiction module component (TIGR02574 family)